MDLPEVGNQSLNNMAMGRYCFHLRLLNFKAPYIQPVLDIKLTLLCRPPPPQTTVTSLSLLKWL